MAYETLIVEAHGAVALIRLNRPEALNALNSQLLEELGRALDAAEADDGVRCLVLTGSDRAFAAGADIGEFRRDIGEAEALAEPKRCVEQAARSLLARD